MITFHPFGLRYQRTCDYDPDPGAGSSARPPIDAVLTGADLSRADLRRANLGGADLRGANLYMTRLEGANLGGADLRQADPRRAKLQRTSLANADLRQANLWKAHFGRTSLNWAKLEGTDLTEVELYNVYIRGLRITSDQHLPLLTALGVHWRDRSSNAPELAASAHQWSSDASILLGR